MSTELIPKVQKSKLRVLKEDADLKSIAAAIISISAVGTGISLSTPLLSLIMEQRGFSSTVIGANTAMSGLASVLAVPFITPLARRIGVVNSILSAILIAAVSLVSFYFFDSIITWFVLRFLFSVGLVIAFVLSEFWINTASPDSIRGFLLGVYATVLSIGFALGPAILSFAGSAGILPFAIGGLIILASVIPAWYARANQPVMEIQGKTPSVFPYLWIVPLATGASFIFGVAESSSLALFPVFGTKYGYTENSVVLFLTVMALGNVAFQIPLGILSDSMKDRRLVLLACAIVGAIGVLLMPVLVANATLLTICLFIYGGVIAGMYTVGLAHLGARLSGADLAQANAAFIMAYAAGLMIGPQVVGITMDIFGPTGFSNAIFASFMLFIILYLYRSRTR